MRIRHEGHPPTADLRLGREGGREEEELNHKERKEHKGIKPVVEMPFCIERLSRKEFFVKYREEYVPPRLPVRWPMSAKMGDRLRVFTTEAFDERMLEDCRRASEARLYE